MEVEAGEALEVGRSHVIKRPRLTRLLDEASARIILLVAPAGYGKTTLAREWLASRPHVWYRGTQAIVDVAALAIGLARATSEVVPGAGDRLRKRLRAAGAPQEEVEQLADLLAEDLRSWPDHTWLVFDDYQFACDSEPAERFVEHLVASSSLRLLVATRSRPRWATARRLLYGEAYEIGRSFLAMSQDEARAILAGRVPKETGGLIALADGWPALLGLAALAEQLDPPAAGMPDELYTYFAEELYQAVPVDIQEGLRRLSLAPAVTPDVAESLVGTDASRIIEEAARLGFFLAASRDRLEFHPLLRSFLASKFIESQDDPDGRIVSGLARTLIERHEWDAAFELIERFFDEDLLIELFETALPLMIDEGRLPTLRRWIHAAFKRKADSPVFDFAEAELMFRDGSLVQAEALALHAARRLAPNHPFMAKTVILAGTAAHLASREEVALDYFKTARALAESDSDARRALWGCFFATAHLDDAKAANSLLSELKSRSGSTPDEVLRVATGELTMTSLRGHLRETLESTSLVAPLADRSRDPLIHSSFLNVHAATLLSSGRYAEAFAVAERETSVAQTYGLAFVSPAAQYHAAAAQWGLRNFRNCQTRLNRVARAAAAGDDGFLLMNVGTLWARLHLAMGAPDRALSKLEAHQHPVSTRGMEAEYLAWRSLSVALAKYANEARRLAVRAVAMSRRIEIIALVSWTKAVLAVDVQRSARTAARDAFRVALETGNIDAFVTAYRACPPLLELLAKDEDNHDQLKVILERARDHSLANSVGLRLPVVAGNEGLGLLSKREREVLQLVTQGLTNKEIGKALYITEGTAKAHMRKICQKLGVRSRTEAALRAAEFAD